MPRITYETYRKRHLILRQLWSERQGLFILISPVEQWALHEYYLCAERATEQSLLAYYQHIRSTQPSLPHRAGKAYAELGRRLQAGRPVKGTRHGVEGKNGKVLSVRSQVQPTVDVDAYIKTVMQIVDRLAVEDPDRLREMTRR
jgi:hypothetical protein